MSNDVMIPRSRAVLANRLAVEDRSRRFVSLTEEGGRPRVLDQPRMKEMEHAAAIGNIDPTLYQHRVGLSVTVFHDPIAQTVLAYEIGVEMPHPIVMPVKSDIVILRACNRR